MNASLFTSLCFDEVHPVTVFTVGVRHAIVVSNEEGCACVPTLFVLRHVAVFTAGQKQWPVLTAALSQNHTQLLALPTLNLGNQRL